MAGGGEARLMPLPMPMPLVMPLLVLLLSVLPVLLARPCIIAEEEEDEDADEGVRLIP